MKSRQNNYAFIDSQNLNLGIRNIGWILDFKKFKKYLEDKYSINQTFLFIGYIKENESLYKFLKNVGYTIIFKPTLKYKKGNVLNTKGNVDAELVLHAMIEYSNYDRAIIVSGDGDFYCLVDYLKKQNKLLKLMIPNKHHYSSLLRNIGKEIAFMNDLRKKLGYYPSQAR